MDFYEVLDQVIELLKQRGRASYQALKIQFKLDEESLDALKLELIEVQELATDRDGKMLVWTGDAASRHHDPHSQIRNTTCGTTLSFPGCSLCSVGLPLCRLVFLTPGVET